MRLISIIMVVALVAIGIASADYVQYSNPSAKDLSGLNLSEIREIFAGDAWFSADIGGSSWTPSISTFLEDRGEGKPAGNVSGKAPLRLGGM
jgi:hypothetical protein